MKRCNEIVINLKNYQPTYLLNPQVMINIVNPCDMDFRLNSKRIYNGDLSVMDCIYLDALKLRETITRHHIVLGDILTKTIYAHAFNKKQIFTFLFLFTSMPNVEVSIYVSIENDSEALAKSLDKNYKNIAKQLSQAKDPSEEVKLQNEKERQEAMIVQVNSDAVLSLSFSLSIRIKGKELSEINAIYKEIKKEVGRYGIRFREDTY